METQLSAVATFSCERTLRSASQMVQAGGLRVSKKRLRVRNRKFCLDLDRTRWGSKLSSCRASTLRVICQLAPLVLPVPHVT